jgi:hypothetical protein
MGCRPNVNDPELKQVEEIRLSAFLRHGGQYYPVPASIGIGATRCAGGRGCTVVLMAATNNSPKVLRTRSQSVGILVVGVIGCVVLVYMGLSPKPQTAVHDVPTAARAIICIVAVLVLAASLRLASCAAVVRRDGVLIRNPISTQLVRWDGVSRFRLGRHGVWPMICILERASGDTVAIWAIQDLGLAARRPGKGAASRLVGSLNAVLGANGPGPV